MTPSSDSSPAGQAAAGVSPVDQATLTAAIKQQARQVGFDLVGIAPAVTPNGFNDFQKWLQRGFAGEMNYLPSRRAAYEHPRHVLESVCSVIMLGVNYRTVEPPPPAPTQAVVARYAWNDRDYHDVLREKLKRLADFVRAQQPGCRTRGIVDTAPLLERDFARMSGLGWFGKNTMLINKRAGSWLFLAALLTDVELEHDEPHESSHCGTCTRCLEACPTDAFPEPYVLDATRCISYLTIELRDQPIPVELRSDMGQWLFGCDVCQDVCPWNRKAPISTDPAFQPVADLLPADAIALLKLDEAQFRDRFRNSPLKRPRRGGLLRNAAIVLGNSGDRSAVPALIDALQDADSLVRGAAAWALGQLGGDQAMAALQTRMPVEDNADVADEIRSAMNTKSEKLT